MSSETIEKMARAVDPIAWAIPKGDDDYPAERARREAKQFTSLCQARAAYAVAFPIIVEQCVRVAETTETPEDGEYWIANRIASAIRALTNPDPTKPLHPSTDTSEDA